MVDDATPAAAIAEALEAAPDAAPEPEAAAEVVTAPEAAPAPVLPERLSLRDWCTRHSKISREVELLGAFFHEERARANHFDTATAYRERFDALRVRAA